MTRARLTAKRVRQLLAYDKASGVLTWRVARGSRKAGARAGGKACGGYRGVHIDGVAYLEHRVIWLHVTGAWPKHTIDHRDLDRSNNRFANLRSATAQQNNQNTPARKTNRSKLKWVRSHRSGKFQTTLQITLGTYDTAEQAHAVGARFARFAHRQFVNTGRAPTRGPGGMSR